ncbi:MAG: hypothetical protein SFW65_06170 [Alphaproteobacteria bacterium]|nr:hypothetical protein [Alphaproteobacteria bacterium]
MEEHLIIYIDFLGFAEATVEWDDKKAKQIIKLLHDLANLRSEFKLIKTERSDGHSIEMRPTVTTFSDHIVMSYPIEKLQILGGENFIEITLFMIQRLVGALAAAAMNLGLLIRGGATIGQLYHADAVVMGKAMVEAYKLESKVALYPRIAFSRKLYSRVLTESRSLILSKDNDGITHLNYFSSMVLAGGGEPGEGFPLRLKIWLDNANDVIKSNIENFEKNEDWNKLSKWVWFNKHFEPIAKIHASNFKL